MSSSSLLSVATFKKREKQNRKKGDKNRLFLTVGSGCSWQRHISLKTNNNKTTKTPRQNRGFPFCVFKSSLSELFSNLPSLDKTLRQCTGERGKGTRGKHPPTSKPASSLQPRDINYYGVTSPNSHVPRSSGSLGLRTVNLGLKCSYRPRGTAILEHTEPQVHRQRAANFTVNMAGMGSATS